MAQLPAYRRHRNVELTIQALVGDTLAVQTTGPNGQPLAFDVPVYHGGGRAADPDEARRPAETPVPRWVETAWIEEGAGRRRNSIWQVNVYSRVGAPASADGDPFGHLASAIADAVEATFAGARDNGTLLAWVPLLDFEDPTDPQPLDACIFVQTPGGDWGVPASRRRLPVSGGFQRVVLTWTCRLSHDAVNRGWYADRPQP